MMAYSVKFAINVRNMLCRIAEALFGIPCGVMEPGTRIHNSCMGYLKRASHLLLSKQISRGLEEATQFVFRKGFQWIIIDFNNLNNNLFISRDEAVIIGGLFPSLLAWLYRTEFIVTYHFTVAWKLRRYSLKNAQTLPIAAKYVRIHPNVS